jgi:hypothetical protein
LAVTRRGRARRAIWNFILKEEVFAARSDAEWLGADALSN